MSDLYDLFGEAASRNPGLDQQRREVLVATIGRAASRTRRRRAAGTALASVAGVAATAGALVGLGVGLGGDSSVAEPGHAEPGLTTDAAQAPSLMAAPSDGPTSGPTVWDFAEPGWFMVETRTADDQIVRSWDEEVVRASGGAVVLVGPDGRTYDAGSLDAVAYTEVVAWMPGGLHLFAETAEGGARLGLGDVVEWRGDGAPAPVAEGVDAPLVAAALDGDRVVHQRLDSDGFWLSVSENYEQQDPLCVTTDDPGTAAVTPDGSAVVCFTALTPDGTDVVVAPTSGRSYSEVMATFTYPAWTYSRIGWVSDTELLFARYTDPGYRYFTLDIESGELTDAEVPRRFEDTLPTYDLASDTFTLIDGGSVTLATGDGAGITTVDCGGEKAQPQVAVSGTRALVACENLGDGAWGVTLVDLESGYSVMVLETAPGEGVGGLGSVWGYPNPRAAG